MKAPAKVLIFTVVVAVVVILITLYRYDLLGSSHKDSSSSASAPAATSDTPAPTADAPKTANNSTSKNPAKDKDAQTPAATTASSATADLANGKKIYDTSCALCHGADGSASDGMGKSMGATDLAAQSFKANKNNMKVFDYIKKVIEEGVPGTAMASFKSQIINEKDRTDLTAYVVSLKK